MSTLELANVSASVPSPDAPVMVNRFLNFQMFEPAHDILERGNPSFPKNLASVAIHDHSHHPKHLGARGD